MNFGKLAKKSLDLILPIKCITCSNHVNEIGSLCGFCWAKIDFITEPMCKTCGFPLEKGAKEGSLCGHCITEEPEFDLARSVFCYNDNSKKLIIDFKYSDRLHAANRFAEWIIYAGRDVMDEVDYIVPVPLHWKRLFQRRYNQSALITNVLSKKTGIESLPMALERKKHTPPQASLTRRQRLNNLKGAFKVNLKQKGLIKGKNVLLVDDVTTTGTTIKECTKVLRKAGAEKVFVLTLARVVEGR